MMEQLMAALGYRFRDPALLRRALTHPSVGREDNQRLEFLGDAVLQFIMSDRLYRDYPEDREGGLTHLRALLVCESALSQVAEGLRLGEALIMDRGEELTGGRSKPSVLCDAMEAVLAAVYLDGGLDAARSVVLRLLGDCSQTGVNDAKSALQEYLQGEGRDMPAYATVGEAGPPHERVFTAAVLIAGKQAAIGKGTSKKRAEQEAASAALNTMKGSGETGTHAP
jgi:ribonuclease-3